MDRTGPVAHAKKRPETKLPALVPELVLEAIPKRLEIRSWQDVDRALHALQGRLTRGLSPIALSLAYLDWAMHLANAPARQSMLRVLALKQFARSVAAAFGQEEIAPAPNDSCFADPAWQTQPFRFFYQSFLLAEEWWRAAVEKQDGVAKENQRIVEFSTRQIVDVFSPSNVPWLNPEVIQTTIRSGGLNLLIGTANFLEDWHTFITGQPQVQRSEFAVGKNLAITPGKVVARTRLMELIQYSPATKEVRPEPVLIVPAWIMKYYILDLSPHNSLIRYLVEQGFTVFAISWRNPGPELADVSMEDYRLEGVMAALDAVQSITKQSRIHACGYCLGGTLLSIAAAAMCRDGDDRLASVTLLAAQTDFTEAGELQIFITEDQVAFLSDLMQWQGYLESGQMAGAFQLLRSNDLIWSRSIRNYMLGQRDHPNDLMFWNADGTRMPARMHTEYLTRLYLNNDLAEGRFPAGGKPVSLNDMKLPLFVVGTETDHVAPWRSVYKIHLLNDSEITFVLTSGGHNAGIVSEPGHPKRHYRILTRPAEGHYISPDEWFNRAELHEGSWWPEWTAWLQARSGAPISPPSLGNDAYPPLCDAPGTYVLEH